MGYSIQINLAGIQQDDAGLQISVAVFNFFSNLSKRESFRISQLSVLRKDFRGY
jgi:hypothetical protein